jgi:hypothetical protein
MTGPELINKLQNMFGLNVPFVFQREHNASGHLFAKQKGFPVFAGFTVYNENIGFIGWHDDGWKIGGTLSTAHDSWNELLDLND